MIKIRTLRQRWVVITPHSVWSATLFNRCDGPDRVELDDGSVIWFTLVGVPV